MLAVAGAESSKHSGLTCSNAIGKYAVPTWETQYGGYESHISSIEGFFCNNTLNISMEYAMRDALCIEWENN